MNRAAWDRHAGAFEATVCDITSTDKKRQLDDLVRLARLPRTGAVLVDLGCGVGSFIRRFGDRFEAIVGVDFAPRILARARQRLPSTIRFLAIEIARSARTLGTIADLTACLNVITSPSAARRAAVWRNLVAVTKPGGFVLVVVPSIESAEMVRDIERCRRVRLGPAATAEGVLERDDVRQKHFSRRELKAVMKEHGLAARRVTRVTYPWSEEGLSKPRGAAIDDPWDWGCLAQRLPVRPKTMPGPRPRKSPAVKKGRWRIDHP
jgi:SAM-dependent methyltransferase